jgi:D-galactarolactone cycloisomerase
MSLQRRALLAMLAALPVGAAAQRTPARRNADGLFAFADDPPPVDFHAHLRAPVRLASAEMLVVGVRGHQFIRVTSTDGHEGVIKANSRMEEVTSLFHQIAVPAFSNVDLRDLPLLIDRVYTSQYKFAGLAFWTAIGHLELAIWDMLGKAAGKRCVDMMGPVLREAIPIYVSSLNRRSTAAEEVAALEQAVLATGAKGAKIKVGGRMSRNADASPGRSEAVVAAVRKHFGDDFIIYADANGSYDAPAAIELCHMLEDHGVSLLEEPCPYEDFEMTRQVVDRVAIPIAGGEQDGAMERWRWYIENRGLDVLQPDFMYNGGMVRTLAVQRMAAKAGFGIAPHYPRNGMETVELLHFAAQAENLYGLQEYRMNPRVLDFAHSPVIAPIDGALRLPPGPGFGVEIDPAIWNDARRL